MKINWKVRFKNKTWLAALIALVVNFVYNLLAAFDVTPPVGQDNVLAVVAAVLTVLTGLGVIIDPTTPGAGDSERAMSYVAPGVTETEPPDGV
jgi:phi LC3 family holin